MFCRPNRVPSQTKPKYTHHIHATTSADALNITDILDQNDQDPEDYMNDWQTLVENQNSQISQQNSQINQLQEQVKSDNLRHESDEKLRDTSLGNAVYHMQAYPLTVQQKSSTLCMFHTRSDRDAL